ncbi:MAG: hypothetical protein Fur0016_07430 [Anaerolineales bacterium]
MAAWFESPLEDGGSIAVEVETPEDPGIRQAGCEVTDTFWHLYRAETPLRK